MKRVFWVQIAYMVVLAALAYMIWAHPWSWMPTQLGVIPLGVPWFGALGGVLISMQALSEHRHDWDDAFRYWHWSRILVSGATGTVAAAIFLSGLMATGQPNISSSVTSGGGQLILEVIAFIAGYSESSFRALVKKIGEAIFTPEPAKPPVPSQPAEVVRAAKPDQAAAPADSAPLREATALTTVAEPRKPAPSKADNA